MKTKYFFNHEEHEVFLFFFKNKKRFFLKFFLLALVAVIISGCSTVSPFKQVSLQPVKELSPLVVKADFAKKIPDKFQIVNSVTFKKYWRSFYSIGCLERDLNKNEFILAALNPAGVKLFQITDDAGKVEYSCSIDEMKKLAPFAKYIAGDIKNIYFGDVPSGKALITTKEDKIIFTDLQSDGKIEYTFGGQDNFLLKKILLKKRGWFWRIFLSDYYKAWSVDYYGYENKNGKIYPINIYYDNDALGYQLVIRLKEIM